MAALCPGGEDHVARLLGNTRRRINWVLWIGLFVLLVILLGAAAWLTSAVLPLLSR